jgi:hypothetical protein
MSLQLHKCALHATQNQFVQRDALKTLGKQSTVVQISVICIRDFPHLTLQQQIGVFLLPSKRRSQSSISSMSDALSLSLSLSLNGQVLVFTDKYFTNDCYSHQGKRWCLGSVAINAVLVLVAA